MLEFGIRQVLVPALGSVIRYALSLYDNPSYFVSCADYSHVQYSECGNVLVVIAFSVQSATIKWYRAGGCVVTCSCCKGALIVCSICEPAHILQTH